MRILPVQKHRPAKRPERKRNTNRRNLQSGPPAQQRLRARRAENRWMKGCMKEILKQPSRFLYSITQKD
ncbi:hypothetical protein CCH79_00014900 [Gambusia affinis]|uniref:Uncharacterized protein n=1 Tax=Gambusia affinis TaxID=33528 RepID=A0A315W3R6_GAMAF|nr:hypothetical protein CCH79_00014900 [Gambusia affinis]